MPSPSRLHTQRRALHWARAEGWGQPTGLDRHALRPELRVSTARVWRDVPQRRPDDSGSGASPVQPVAVRYGVARDGAGGEPHGETPRFLPRVLGHNHRPLGKRERGRLRGARAFVQRLDIAPLTGALIACTCAYLAFQLLRLAQTLWSLR